KRKKFIENISRQLKTRYGFDFIELISKNLRVSINTKNLDKYDFLEFEFLESEKIVATDAFEMILRAIDDKEFFNFVENYRNNGFIDC
ncbi:ThiF family adenylyltransferase, partial [Streptococcus thermophilus]